MLFQAALGLTVLGLFGLAVLYALVQNGPLSMGFLVGPFEEAISRELGTGRVEIENAVLRQSEDGRGIEFRLANLRVKDAAGTVLAETPLAGISLSGAAILRGRLAPVSVEFIRPRLRLTTTASGGLALAVSRPPEAPGSSGKPSGAASPRSSPSLADPSAADSASAPRPIDLVAALQHTMAEFRHGEAASAYLRELGLRDATLTIEHGAHQAVWHIPGFTIDVQHFQKRSVIVGEGLIGSDGGTWGLSFRTTESGKARRIRFETEIAELVPRTIAANVSFLPGLSALDMAVGGTAVVDIALDEGVAAAELKLTLAPGRLILPAALGGPVKVSGGNLHLRYAPAERQIVVHPSELIWNNSRATWSGHVVPATSDDGPWQFNVTANGPVLEGVAIESIVFAGHVTPLTGHTRIEKLLVQAQGAQVALSGGTVATDLGPAIQLDGSIGPLALSGLQTWLKSLAPEAAQWIQANVRKGRIAGGTLRLAPSAASLASPQAGRAGAQPPLAAANPGPWTGVSVDLELQDLHIAPANGYQPVTFETGRLRLDNGRLEIATPQARLPLPSGRHLALKEPRLTVTQLASPTPQAEVVLQATAPASVLFELIEQEPWGQLRIAGLEPGGIEGRAEASLKASFPVVAEPKPSDIKLEGRIRLSEVRSKGLLGGLEISGGNILLGVTDKALDAKGDLLIAGVPAKVSWQRIFGATAERQPPARLTATLDATDRDTLGLDVNHLVQGDVPVVVSVQYDAQGQPHVHLEANLGGAELVLHTMAWRKPPGRPAVLHCDVVRAKDGRTELQGFKIIGDDIALDGSMVLDAKNEMRSFHFPAFAVNVLTKLEMQGRVRDDGVLEVKTKGTAYDGRPFFRAMFSSGQITEKTPPQPKKNLGLDLSVEIDTIIGFTDTNLRNVQFSLKRRGDKVVTLQATGSLSDSGLPVTAEIKTIDGARMLHATSTDAGSALRLIGFYPNMRGGHAQLDVNLDGKGYAQKTGRLRTDQFAILGDPVVSEVLQSADERRKAPRAVVREQIEFDHLDVPFSVGHGQVVLGHSTINGPLLGARLNGKIDYNKQTVFVEGTYVPLYGLNSIPNNIPIIGEILSGGRAGDGLFGITFQIQGPMGRPQVLVNPLSMLTPGLLRQIWESAPQGQSVVPRAEPPASRAPAQSSSSPALTGDPRTGTSRGASSSTPQRITDPAAKETAASVTSGAARAPARDRAGGGRSNEDGQ